MRNAPIFLLLLLCAALVGASTTRAQNANPKQARALFDKADQALNAVWASAKSQMDEGEFNALKSDQKDWMAHRDYLARSPLYTGAEAEGELSLDSTHYLEAAAAITKERTEWLKGLLREWQAEETLTGFWSDSYGGTIEIVEKDEKLHFIISCVRGPTSHLGDLAGIAAWNTRIGWFSNKGREEGSEEETNLAFVLRSQKLEVLGANTSHYHGARAYFDGEYVKVRSLDAKQQTQVLQAAKTGELPGNQ